jgi:hypothetical protein
VMAITKRPIVPGRFTLYAAPAMEAVSMGTIARFLASL